MTEKTLIASDFKVVTAQFVRPADTTAYAAGDVVCDSTSAPTVLTLSGVASDRVAGGVYSGILKEVMAICSANNATLPDLRMWLFDVAPAAVADNAAWTPTDLELEALVTILSFPRAAWIAANAGAAGAGNAVCNPQALEIGFNTVGRVQNALFAVITAVSAYTPISGEVFKFRFKVIK